MGAFFLILFIVNSNFHNCLTKFILYNLILKLFSEKHYTLQKKAFIALRIKVFDISKSCLRSIP